MQPLNIGSDFSGVGAFNQALQRLNIPYNEIFACDMDKYARQTFTLNFGEPHYYPKDVYEREIPTESLDIYMSSPPCQAFSLAGKRKGEDDKRGILFYNTHEFICKNAPRYFIIENVKGLLSDDNGKTFQRWIDYLGGKSVNGNPVLFPHDEAAPYHVYFQVLNAKSYGVPQNRERVFIIGIRDDADNTFSYPKPFHLVKRLKDVLESEVDEKYFLSELVIKGFLKDTENQKEKGNGFAFSPKSKNDISNSISTKNDTRKSSTFINIGTWRTHEDGKGFRATEDNNCPTIPARAREDGSGQPVIKINTHSITEAKKNRRKLNYLNKCEVIQLNISKESGGVQPYQQNRVYDINGLNPALTTLWNGGNLIKTQRIRRLTPLECFRLMDFNPTFKWEVSDSQAYKQAGNSIVVSCLAEIIKKLKF